MPENYEQIAGGPSQVADPLDPVLDAALAKYAAVEPRAGLEDRSARPSASRAVTSAAAPGGAGDWLGRWRQSVIVALALAWRAGRSHRPMQIIRRPPDRSRPAVHKQQPPERTPRRKHPYQSLATGRCGAEGRASSSSSCPGNPKLDVFPSPQPLSAEELALAQYVRNFPSDAKQVAQAQEASEREVLAKMQALANESTESN